MLSEVLSFLLRFAVFFLFFSLLFTPGGLFILAAIFLGFIFLMPLFITAALVGAILDE